MKVAIVCDWLTSVGGAERVLKSIADLFPDAPIFTSQYNEKKIDWFKDREVNVGWLQIFPTGFRRFLGPLRQVYFDHLDLSSFDLIISVSGAEAKSVKKGNALHLCYCHVPTQYYWGLKDDYLKNPGFGILNPLARVGLKLLLPPLKSADFKAAQRPDEFITISTYAAEEIKKAYNRESTIIYPPVAVEKFSTKKFSTGRETLKPEKSQISKTEQKNYTKEIKPEKSQERYGYVTTSRQVTWKRLDLAVEACLALKVPLTIIGEGPEHKNLVRLAKKSKLIKFVPLTDQEGLKTYLENAKGYIFPSLEPFGIAPVEALACGCPVIAYGNGGALDYVIDGENGVLFGKQSVNSLRQALKRFEALSFDEEKVKKSALPFSEKYFTEKLKTLIVEKVKEKKETKAEKVKPEREIKEEKVKPSPVVKAPASAPKPKPKPQPKLKPKPKSKKPKRSVKKPTIKPINQAKSQNVAKKTPDPTKPKLSIKID
ncbi:glycosyltransferase [Candidatus Saccharibacteria bacterium]|nr:glycosyltransferase [Candidatus Saccharibacteria bacterium]